MLSQCANSQCSKPFLRLREGKLFVVEVGRLSKPGDPAEPRHASARKSQKRVEHYWLCDDCSRHWTLACDAEQGIALAPLRRPTSGIA